MKTAGGVTTAPTTTGTTVPSQAELFYYENISRDASGRSEILVHTGNTKKRKAILKAGSKISTEVSDSFASAKRVRAYRDALIKSGKIKDRVLQEDITFPSQSGVGEFLNGTSFDGNSNWKTVSGDEPLKKMLV